MNEIRTTVVGNLTEAPELKFTPSGKAVAAFTVAVNRRRYENGEWVDAEPSFTRVTAWGQLAENVAESAEKGTRVIVHGTFAEERWTDKESGQPRSAWKLTAESVGLELTFATAVARKGRRQAAPDPEWDSYSTTRPVQTAPSAVPAGANGTPNAR